MQIEDDETKITENDGKNAERLTEIQVLSNDLTQEKQSNIVS